MQSGGNDEELVLDVAVKRDDEATLMASVEFALGGMLHSNRSLTAPVMTDEASPSS